MLTQGRKPGVDWQGSLTEPGSVVAMLDALQPELVLNLAALTNVDTCEEQPQQAYLLNVRVVQELAQWLAARHADGLPAYLLHISSDQVYDGSISQAAASGSREDQVQLKNTYAFSKLASELAAAIAPAACLRTNFFGKSACAGRNSFSDWIVQGLQQQQQRLSVFEDVYFSPLSITSLTQLLAELLQLRPQGVFNLGSRDGMSKADFAFALAQAVGLSSHTLQRSQSADAALRAARPRDMRMDCSKLEQILGRRMPQLATEIALCGRDYRES